MIKIFYRYLQSNYWDCPTHSYSTVQSNDYTTTKSQCGEEISNQKEK